MPRFRGRLRRRGDGDAKRDEAVFEIDPGELTGVFRAPNWLRDAGLTSWLLVGITLLLVGLVWIASLTSVIVIPVIVAAMIAAVTGQLVSLLQRHGVPRVVGAILVLFLIVVAGALAAYLIMAGIASESSDIAGHLKSGADTVEGWLKDLGVSDGKAHSANENVSSGSSDTYKALLHGSAIAIVKLSSIVFFVAMATLALVFLLKDGPMIRAWADRHMGVPRDVATTITGRVLESLRGYFLGVTIIACFNALLVGGGALLLGIPLAGTIAVVTFIGAYIPYIGAWSAGAFSVLIALGGAGPEEAGGMVAIQLLSNGPLQQIVQPIAYGAALGIHPLAVLIVTIAGGALFGAVGLILAAPLTSAVVRIAADLGQARSEAAPAEATQSG